MWPSHYLIPEHFLHPKKKACVHYWSHSIMLTSSPWQPLIYLLSLQMCLLRTLHMNEFIHYVTFGNWCLSLNTLFKFIDVVAWIVLDPFYGLKIFYCMDIYCIFLFTSWYLSCFSFLSITYNAAMNSLHVDICLNSLGYILRSWTAGSYDNFTFSSLKSCPILSKRLHHFKFPAEMSEGSSFSTS